MNNVVNMKTPVDVGGLSLDQLADQYKQNEHAALSSKIEHYLRQGAILSEARRRFPSDNDFGAWCRSVNFTDRSQKTMFNQRTLFDVFGHLPVETIKRIGLSNCYKLASSDQAIRQRVSDMAQAGSVVTGEIVGQLLPPTEKPQRRTLAAEAPERPGRPGEIDTAMLGKTQKQRYDALARRLERKWKAEFDEAVRTEAQRTADERIGKTLRTLEADVEALADRCDRLSKPDDRRLTPDEYRAMKMVLSMQGNPSEDTKRDALRGWEKLSVKPLTQEEVERSARFIDDFRRAVAEREAKLRAKGKL